MASYHYVGDVNANLLCCICRSPFFDPVITKTCLHTFCRSCITQALDISPTCPVDRSPLTADDLRSENLLLRNIVNELLVECTQRPAGCMHTCQRQLLTAHLRDDCPFVQVACAADGCDETVLRRDVGEHAHDCLHRVTSCAACGAAVKVLDVEAHHTECVAQDVSCAFCGDVILREELPDHHAACPLFVVPCTHAPQGCPWTGARRERDTAHVPQCPYEAIKGFLTLHAAHTAAVEVENAALRTRVQEMDTAIRAMRRDLDTARRALGPWWRTDDPEPRPADAQMTADLASMANEDPLRWSGASSLSPAGNHAHEHGDAYRAGPGYTEQDYLAPYFPPAHHPSPYAAFPASAAATEHTPSHYRTASLGGGPSAFPHARRGDPRPSPPSHSSVAPIDLSTTLEGALASLRSSVVTLSASLDSLGRRQDIALTAENLRVTEEVGALRGAIHGLRMQVHSIMLERNKQMTGRSGGDAPAPGHDWVPASAPYYHPAQHAGGTSISISTTKL